uniref:Uncharacterized protein n=1 Tax=Cucumis sativus TaxID=3659 RepID=A0A0A0KQR6_CUCSA
MHNQWLPIPSSLSSFSPPPSPLGASFKFQVGGLKGWGVLWPLIGLHNKAGFGDVSEQPRVQKTPGSRASSPTLETWSSNSGDRELFTSSALLMDIVRKGIG